MPNSIIIHHNQGCHGIKIVSKATATTTIVKCNASDEGHRAFGFHLVGDGTSIAHKKVMINKAVLYGKSIA
jgi:hypothetical protein